MDIILGILLVVAGIAGVAILFGFAALIWREIWEGER